MNQYYSRVLLAVTTCLIFSSCKKFLEVTPKSVANENAFYKTKQDAIVAATSAYNPLQSLYRESMWLLGEVMSDNTDDLNVAIDNFTFDAADLTVEKYWQANYLGIARCNTVIDRLPALSQQDEALVKRLILEMRYLRAFYYFNLVRSFGEVPLVVKEVRTQDAAKPSRNSVTEVYDQVIADLKAAEDLPVSYASSDLGRATKGAAKGLLANVYLTQKKYQLAADKAKEVIDLGVYNLLPNYADNFKATTENNAESVFEVQFVTGAQTGTGGFLGNNFFEWFAPPGSGSAVTGVANSSPQGYNIPTADIVNAYEAGDARKDASVRTSYTKPGSPPQTVTVNYIVKHLDPTAAAGSLGVGSSNNWRVMRFAEVLLIYAEALNEASGGNALAAEAVNKVRRRAGGATPLPDHTGLNQDDLRIAIAKERRSELAFENHRWFDLLRTGKTIEVLSKTKNIQPRNVLLPVPLRERKVNDNLSQNKDY